MTDYSDIQAVAERLLGANLRTKSIGEISAALNELMSSHRRVNVELSDNMIWFRARTCQNSKPFDNLSEVLYHKVGSPDIGRANNKGARVLYASWNIATALDEIGANQGDIVQLALVRPRRGVPAKFLSVGDLKNFHHTGRPLNRLPQLTDDLKQLKSADLHTFLRAVLVDAILSELFRTPGNQLRDYRITSAFAHLAYSLGCGVIYPSVEVHNSLNFAIEAPAFNAACEVVETCYLEVTSVAGYGLFEYQVLNRTCAYGLDGEIDWSVRSLRKIPGSPEAGSYEDEYIPGWRVEA